MEATENAEVSRLLGPAFSETKIRNALYRHQGIRVGRKLGSGTFGTVYDGEVVNTGQKVAIKVLAPADIDDYKHVKAEVDHAMAVSDHPRFPTFYEHAMTVGGVEYMVMELAIGTLFDLRNLGREWDHRLLAFYGLQLVQALTYLASMGICHRDLKPENMLLNKDGMVLVGEFISLFDDALLFKV